MTDHLVIPDVQMKPGLSLRHLDAAGRFIKSRKPKVIVCIGDFWDFPSIGYDRKTIHAEGQRLVKDIDAGNRAMDLLLSYVRHPCRLIFTEGNHEDRLRRLAMENPEFDGLASLSDLNLSKFEIYPFLQPAVIDGIHYAHYFANPFSGKPYGGTIANMIQKIGFSFTMGHKQTLEWGRKDLANGQVIQGLIAGAFYQHNERYKGPQGNHHWRGIIYKHGVKNGKYDLETISLHRLLRDFG